MAEPVSPDVIVYLCQNSVPQGMPLPRQWEQNGAHVLVRVVPCSGKMDSQYLLHAIEGGGRGVCVVTCAKGECTLAQGNYRAEIRVATMQRLLKEIGIEPERAELVRCQPGASAEEFDKAMRDSVARIAALGPSPIPVSTKN